MQRVLWIMIVYLALVLPVSAQEDDACADRLETARTSCEEFGDASICYGAGRVSAIQDCETPASFDTPGDVIPLQGVCSMHLGARVALSEWGLAVLHLEGQSDTGEMVSVVLSGDVDIQNSASARQTQTVTIMDDVTARRGPGLQFDAVQELQAEDTVRIDGCNCTGNWVRLLFDDGQSGWIPARFIEEQDAIANLPTRDADTPVYTSMQAFRLTNGENETGCMRDGALIQVPESLAPYPMEINGVALELDAATLFVHNTQGDTLNFVVLDGVVRLLRDDRTTWLNSGMTATVDTVDEMQPMRIVPTSTDDLTALPLELLPDEITPEQFISDPVPWIAGAPECRVLSDRGETLCELDFVNADGDDIVRVTVDFVRAAEGEWTGSVHEMPELLTGTNTSGTLAVPRTCSVGAAGVILGPVEWSITIEDAAGNISNAFTAMSFCVVE